MAMSLNALKKFTKEELSNMVIDYQSKFDNMLSNINTELTFLNDWFTEKESQLLVIRRVDKNLTKQIRILERKCAANEQYSRREYLEIAEIPDSISKKQFRRNCLKNF